MGVVLNGWDVTNLAVEADCVVPVDPLDDRDLEPVAGPPGAVQVDQLSDVTSSLRGRHFTLIHRRFGSVTPGLVLQSPPARFSPGQLQHAITHPPDTKCLCPNPLHTGRRPRDPPAQTSATPSLSSRASVRVDHKVQHLADRPLPADGFSQ